MALPGAPMITAAAAANPEKMTQIPRMTIALLQRALMKGNDATSTLKKSAQYNDHNARSEIGFDNIFFWKELLDIF